MKEKFAANNINFVFSQSNSSGVGNFFGLVRVKFFG
jgi:hypothetical protein